MNDLAKNKRGISLSTQILIGLTLGLFVGLFLGDKASALAIVGKAYIGLIQMSILPYMIVSLMLGIGSLSYEKAAKLAIMVSGLYNRISNTPCFSLHGSRLFLQFQSGRNRRG
jgi:Na+/H+-dicarboxylate symporter